MSIEDLLFVHGTGVRAARYGDLVREARAGLEAVTSEVSLHGCYWADVDGGTELRSGGVSIPQYDETGGGGENTTEDAWSVAQIDPLHAIRILAHSRHDERNSAALISWVNDLDFKRSASLLDEISGGTGAPELLAQIVASTEFGRLAQNVAALPDQEVQSVVARTMVSMALFQRGERVAWEPHGSKIELAFTQVSRDLGCHRMGTIGDAIKGFAVGTASQLFLGRQRGKRSDETAGVLGDILRYQAHGKSAREYLRSRVRDLGRSNGVGIVAHSLGGIAAFEMLVEGLFGDDPLDCVDLLVTVGSQAPLMYEIDALATLRWGTELPARFPKWVNVYDPVDLLAYRAAPLFEASDVIDVEVDNQRGFPAAHSAYFGESKRGMWSQLRPYLEGAS